jgi:transcriptional regulator with XRE-family HTH domain
VSNILDVGQILRDTRKLLGLSQRRLASRAGTSQDAISRIERGAEVPTFERFAQLMLVMGQRVDLRLESLEGRVPASELAVATAMTPEERLREAASWNRMASQLDAAGARARRAGHPATRSDRDE